MMNPENNIATKVLDAAFAVHKALGPGLFESAYEEALAFEMRMSSLAFGRQVEVPIRYRDAEITCGFRADLIVDGRVIIELKSVETVTPVHKKQLLTYLRLTGMRLGLLVNFNEVLLKNGIYRVAN